MSQLIQSFYRNVQTICMTDNELDLITYLSNDGLILLKQLNATELNATLNPIPCRDFGLFLIKLLSLCYSHVSNDDAELGLHNIPPINSLFKRDKDDRLQDETPSNIFETLNYIFDTIVHLFHLHSNHDNQTLNISLSEINNIHIEIARAFVNLVLPPLTTECKIIWFYQKKIRSLLLIFQHIISSQPSSYTTNFTSNPIGTIITTIHNYLSSTTSQFLIQLGFDTLQGFALLIENVLNNASRLSSVQRRGTNDLLNLISQLLISDYFTLFTYLNSDKQNESNSIQLLEHCSIILKRLKIYRSEEIQRKQNRHFIKRSWENSYEQACFLHYHQSSFEITINNRNTFDGDIEIKHNPDDNNQIKRVCVISAMYGKLLRLAIKELEVNQPSFLFIHDCLAYLISYGSCSCYSLSHYRTLLAKINHLKLDENIVNSLEQQSIRLLRQAFFLLSNCSQRNHHHHHHHENQLADNTLFWTYLSNHLFQRSSRYSLKLVRSFPELIQCCSITDKQLALRLCITSSLEHYRTNVSAQISTNIEIIECLIRTLPNLLFDIVIDTPFASLSDTLIALSSLFPALLIHTLPVLGCLLTSTSDSLTINVSESFLQLIVKLTNQWTLSQDGIDNLCLILIILLQKCPIFRQAFYARICHLHLFDQFKLIFNSKSTPQSSIIASVLVAISYYNKPNDDRFNYKLILEQINAYSEKHRYTNSWFELLIRLSLSQQYQDKRTRWKSSTINKHHSLNEIDDENSLPSAAASVTNYEDENFDDIDEDEVYHADVESLSDDTPVETTAKQNQNMYSNLILFPELVILGLEIAWQNVDNEWNDQQSPMRASLYVTNLVTYLELLSLLVRANSYNCIVLKKANIDSYLFNCLTKIVPRSAFIQKDTLISLIITLLQFLWSQSITVSQLDQCFKLILTHPSLVGPLLRLFKHLVNQIDSNQPRSYCSMPLSSIVTSKGGSYLHLTLDQLLFLKYPPIENEQINLNVRQSAIVTETLKSVQIHFPLTIAIWLRVNYPFDKRETNEEKLKDNEDLNKKDYRPILHILTLHHEGIQFQFWLDSKPDLCLKIVQFTSATNQQLIDHTIRLYNLPRESWSHIFLTISKTNNFVSVCLNGQTSLSKKHPLPSLYSPTSVKPWSISLGQQSLDTCTSFYYDLGSILLFDKQDLWNPVNSESSESTNDFAPTYLYSLGSDHWHFLTASQQQQSISNSWIYQRFTRVHSSMPIDKFEAEQTSCVATLKRSIIASYSSNNPWTLFLFNSSINANEDTTPSRLNKILPFRSQSSSSSLITMTSMTTSNDDNLVSSATTLSLPSKISLEQSSNILNICEQLGGILNFIYLFGKLIEINAYQSSSSICHISDIIFTSIWKIKSYYELFNSLDGYRLIVKILTTNECARHITNEFYEVLIDKCIVLNQQRLYDVNLSRYILLDWKIWYNHPKIFSLIIKVFNDLLCDHPNRKYPYVNRQLFKSHFTLEHLLIFCQEIIDEQKQIIIDENLTVFLVNIIEALVENDLNIISLLMHFVLLIHPLVKTYVTYNKEHFYFIVKPLNYYQAREKYEQENLAKQRAVNDRHSARSSVQDEQLETSLSIRKSHSFSDILSSSISMENETHSNRRVHYSSVSGVTTSLISSKNYPSESNQSNNKEAEHNVDHLSAGILKLLANVALTTPDRLMIKLIDHVFRLNILIVLLLDASMAKRVACIKLLNIVLTRMNKDKVQDDVLRADLHTMLANQIYHQLDGREDAKQLLEVCVSIALQRPVEFDLTKSLMEQIHEADQYFSILTSSPPCPRSQVGFALVLSFVEKLSTTNVVLCELVLNLLENMILRSNDENRHYLVDIGLTQVLFNTLSSAIFNSQEKIISSVQKCFNSLIVSMFTTTINDDISFMSIIDNIMGMMMNEDIQDQESSKYTRRVLHQTLSNMFNSIIDSIEKPPAIDISLYQLTTARASVDDHNLNSNIVENHERFRKFLQLALDYIYAFHNECYYFENFTLRLLDISLLGIAYLIEKRSNYVTPRHQMSLIIFRCGDIIKQIGQKLLTIALDPEKQRFFFRIKILKLINEQPNVKGIMEYLLTNDNQCYIYHQILLYLQVLAKTNPQDHEFEQLNCQSSSEQSKQSFDSGHQTLATPVNKHELVSNGEESSSHTVYIHTRSNTPRNSKSNSKGSVKTDSPTKQSSSSDEEKSSMAQLSISSSENEEQEIRVRHISDRSSSPSLSISSISSELASLQQHSSFLNYQHTINSFRDLMAKINVQSLPTTVDNNQTQRRGGLTKHLLAPSPSSAFQTLKNSFRTQRHSLDSQPSDAQANTSSATTTAVPTLRRRRSHAPSSSTSISGNASWQKVTEQKREEYRNTLDQLIEATQNRFISTHKSSLQTFSNETISTITSRAMEITQDVINLQSFERKKFLEHLRLTQSVDLQTKHLWHQLISQLTHEFGVWFEPLSYPKYWELDPTENPQRERRRLQRSYCLMEKRFFQTHVPEEVLVNPPLSYLFDTRHYQSVNVQTVLHRNEKIEYQCRCTNVTPNNEIKGELLVGSTRIYFVAEEQVSSSTKTKSANSAMTSIGYNHRSFNDNSNSFSFAIDEICEMYKRRYLLLDLALELFFINGITLMIAHATKDDRDNLYRLLAKRHVIHAKPEDKVSEIQSSWKQGNVNNFDYLMQLNKLAGRTYLDLMQYPVYPYVVANYEALVLDLRVASNYRNLSKPIAIQHPDKEEKFIDNYNALEDARALAISRQQESDEQQPLSIFGHESDPYHFASLYSNSGIVLHYMVRLLPYTRMFLDYQDNNFDCPDRTFHDTKTSYWLSSFESTSDFKEVIPEFYYLHELLLNKQSFNFGKRQNGEPVSDVVVAPWAKRNPRLYVYGLRQALESDYVTAHLHQWIDLIFGNRQTGKAALDAINVYHAACYFGYPIEEIKDELTLRAYHVIIRTYGQVPKQLFTQAHPAYSANNSNSGFNINDKRLSERAVFESKLPPDSIHRQIIGVQWGDFVGSYDMPTPEYISSYECAVQVSSFVVRNSGSCIVCLPPSSLLLYNEYLINESTGEQVNATTTQIDTMIALKWNTPDGVVRCRQLKQMKHWYNFIVPINDQDKITCCASIDYRLLFMGKKSGLIEIYGIERNKNAPAGIELGKRYLPFIAHRSPITCLHINRHFSLLISASADGMLTLWDTNRLSYVRTYKQENQRIYHLTSSDTTGDIAYLSSSGSQWHLFYLTCNCDLIGYLTFPEQLNCLCFTSAPEGTSVNVLLGGFENGRILMWSTWDLTLLRQLDFPQLRLHPIVALCVSKIDRRRLYVSDRDRHLHTIETRLSSTSTNQAPQILFLS